jgi:hypothetical protein
MCSDISDINPTINLCCPLVVLLRRLSFFLPSVSSRSFCCPACIRSVTLSLLLHVRIHCTIDVAPARDAAVYFFTLLAMTFLWLLMYVAIVCAVDLSKNDSMSVWNSPISTGLALSFNSFNFLASGLSFVFRVLSCCSTVFPCTSSLRSSHSCMKFCNVISTTDAPHTYPSLFFPTVVVVLLLYSCVHSCVIFPVKKCLHPILSCDRIAFAYLIGYLLTLTSPISSYSAMAVLSVSLSANSVSIVSILFRRAHMYSCLHLTLDGAVHLIMRSRVS